MEPYDAYLGARVTEGTFALIELLAGLTQRTVSEVVRSAIERELAREGFGTAGEENEPDTTGSEVR